MSERASKKERQRRIQKCIHAAAEKEIKSFLAEVGALVQKHQLQLVYAVRSAGCTNLSCFTAGVLLPKRDDKVANVVIKEATLALVNDALYATLKPHTTTRR